MPLATITYQEVINEVKNWIKNNCKNITSYSSISSAFKSGWSKTETVLTGEGYTGTGTTTISGGAVPQATAAEVDSDMTSFYQNTCKLTNSDLSKNISEANFYYFIQDMLSFICTKCVFATSQYAQSERHLIYKKDNTTFNTTFSITINDSKNLMEASDITSLMTTMLTVVNQNLRCNHCTYSIAISGV